MNRNDQEFIVQKIRTQYTEKQATELDALRKLDARVKRPANVFAYLFGGIGAIIMGSGISLIMTDIGETVGAADPMGTGVVIGVIGILMMILNYPIYKQMLNSRKKKYVGEIIRISDSIADR